MVFYCDEHNKFFKSYEKLRLHGGCHCPINKMSGGYTAYGTNSKVKSK